MTTIVANTFNWIGLEVFVNWFKKQNAEMTRRRNIRHTIKELNKLSTYELNDIGIARGEIYDIAHSSYPKSAERVKPNSNLRGWV